VTSAERGSAAPLSAEAVVVARGSVINLVAMIAGAVLSFGLVVLVSRWLQPRGAGAFFELIALFTIMSNTFELGADTGLTRWISRARAIGGLADVRRLVVIAIIPVLIISAAAAVGLWLSAPQVARLFLHSVSPAAGATDIRIIAPLVPIGALSACVVDGARGFGRMWPYLAIEGFGKPALRIGLVVIVLIAGAGLHGAILAWGLPVVLGLALGCVIFARLIAKEVPASAAGPGRRGAPVQPAGANPPRPASQLRPASLLRDAGVGAAERPAATPPAAMRPSAMRRAATSRGVPSPAGRASRAAGGSPLAPAGPPAAPRVPPRPEFLVTPELAATLEFPVVFDVASPAGPVGQLATAGGDRGRHRGPWRPVAGRNRRLATEFWGFTGPRAFQATFQVVILWLDILLVGALVSGYAAGVYSAVSKLAIVGTFALEGNRLAIAPQLSTLLSRRQHDRAADLYQSATRWLMLASWPMYLVLAVFPAVVLSIFGARYMIGASALAVLSLAMLVNLGTGNVTVVLLMGGKSSWSALNAGAALAINIGLNLWLVPRMGILGAAIAWAASIVVDNVTAMVEVRWVLGLAPFGPGYGLVAAITVGCFGGTGIVFRVLLGQTLPALGATLAVGLVAYGAALFLARGPLQLTGLVAAVRLRPVPPVPKPADQQAS
jgi:O-antigen/teichoic acid export membrane protein